MGPVGLYIHIPYCRTKCGYCDFNSGAWEGSGPEDYREALITELGRVATGWAHDRLFSSIFIGGGTPTIYSGEALAGLVAGCRERLSFSAEPEITVETNPNTVSAETLLACLRGGVNRLSIGVQAFSDRLLTEIGRSHSVAQAVAAVTLARGTGFTNINLDLIYGLPTQSLADWRQSLEQAVALDPEHLALYGLSVEPGTPFGSREAKGQLPLPDDDLVAEMAELGHTLLAAAGYQRYEISNYARPGKECRHNLNYWHNGPYLGLGAGAVSSFDGLRLKNLDDPGHYLARIAAGHPAFVEGEALGHAASFRESVIMGLRMITGVPLAALSERYGLDPLTYYGPTLTRLCDQGLIAMDQERMWLTAQALPVANQVLAELV